MKLYIKNMVCPRCIQSVQQILTNAGLQPTSVILGEAEIPVAPDENALQQLKQDLSAQGFELLEDTKLQLIDKIKSVIIEQVQNGGGNTVYSGHISKAIGKDYSALSKLFSAHEGITIEQYIILQKIEKVKELLAYNQLTLSEIAGIVGYSSTAHLSGQFRKVTGYTPTAYRQLDEKPRLPLDGVTKQV